MSVFVVLPEEMIKQAAMDMEGEENNNFLKVLRAGEIFRKAGLTPVYILDQIKQDLVVIAEETHGKKLH